MGLLDPIEGWLAPLKPMLARVTTADWALLRRFTEDLVALLEDVPAGKATGWHAPQLLAIRRHLAELGHTDVVRADWSETARARLLQALRQFICGFVDVDLRDATGAGHGRMILRHGRPEMADSWAVRLRAGDLVGIAATERHGGSRLREITTTARHSPGRGWLLTGEKCWVSRIDEASAFVVFFRNPGGAVTAAVVRAEAEGLRRSPVRPAGLAGWSWGTLQFADVTVTPDDLLGADGDGLTVLREHFMHYRPLVSMTALGAAASIHGVVADALRARVALEIIPRLRDTTLVTIGRTHAELNAALLGVLAAVAMRPCGSSISDLWAQVMKAHGIDTANRASAELPLLVGALGFANDSRMTKVRNDLTGLLYADGIHDSLYRAAGRTLVECEVATIRSVRRSPGTRTDPPPVRSGRRPDAG
jgi:alkylation response protein AidB-like acyl-CoA dehydrogenase